MDYWVDPNYGGGNGASDGSKAKPWTDLGGWGSSPWSTINTALSSGSVSVYFSAAVAAGNSNQTSTNSLIIARTAGTQTYTLTLDGNTYYNNNDSAPSESTWLANPASYKYQINVSYPLDQECSGGYGNCTSSDVQDRITIKGFYLNCTTPANSVYIFGINNLIFTQNTTRGAFHIEYGNTGGINEDNGGLHNIEISYNDMSTQNLDGETLYFGSCGYTGTTNCHDNVSIHHNTMHDSTGGSGQQDGLDIKGGTTNLSVYNNTIYNCAGNGIISHSGGSYYNNTVYNNGYGGITISSFWGGTMTSLNIYNNVIYGNTGETVVGD